MNTEKISKLGLILKSHIMLLSPGMMRRGVFTRLWLIGY